jgi:hypothetical protein
MDAKFSRKKESASPQVKYTDTEDTPMKKFAQFIFKTFAAEVSTA